MTVTTYLASRHPTLLKYAAHTHRKCWPTIRQLMHFYASRVARCLRKATPRRTSAELRPCRVPRPGTHGNRRSPSDPNTHHTSVLARAGHPAAPTSPRTIRRRRRCGARLRCTRTPPPSGCAEEDWGVAPAPHATCGYAHNTIASLEAFPCGASADP